MSGFGIGVWRVSALPRTTPTSATGRCVWGWACAGVLPVLLFGCGGDDIEGNGSGPRPPAVVRIGQISEQTVTPSVTVIGSVVPVRTSVVASGASGVVQRFHVQDGDYVRSTQPLSELRTHTTDLEIAEAVAVLTERERELAEMEAGSRQEDIDEARAKMTAAKAIMNNMSKKLDRARSLSSRNVITEDQYEDALEKQEASRQVYLATEATYKRVMAGPRKEQIGQAQARVDAQQNHVEFLNAEKDKRITRAPFAGFVVQEHTNLGQWLAKGDPIVTLAQMDQVDVIANVDQRDESLVRLFEEAQVRINGIEQRDWTGRIEAIVPRSDWRSGSRGFPVKVRLRNTAQAVAGTENNRRLPLLKEGMMAHVTFRGAPLQALLVPKNALVRTSRGTQIFLFTPLMLPKWTAQQSGKLLGHVVAADDQAARNMARKQFEIGEGGTALQVTQTTRPRWQVNRTPRPGQNSEVIGYLQADSQDLALAEARKQFGVDTGQVIVVLPQLGTVRRIVVELGISEGENVQLLGSQANSGAFVVTEGAERLNDYQDVQLSREKIITNEATITAAE